VVPAGVNIHDEVRVPMGVSGRIGSDPARGTAELAHEDLALVGWQPSRIVDDGRDGAIVESGEIVRFPIIAAPAVSSASKACCQTA
jgi:hypothetical protein